MMKLFNLEKYNHFPALIDGESGAVLSYKALEEAGSQFINSINHNKALIFLFIKSNVDFLIAYIALLNHGHAVAIFDNSLHPDLKQKLISCYRPHFIVDRVQSNRTSEHYEFITTSLASLSVQKRMTFDDVPQLHDDLHLLLSTSGTTGNPKLIRLSQANLMSNASAICNFLKIDFEERALATLPFHYSYGLSVLHTHLYAGASLVLTPHSAVQQEFWNTLNKYKCTSLAGVPTFYQMLERLDFENIHSPTIHTLTQAGGRLSTDMTLKFHAIMKKRHGQFITMYGQTEATARISYLPFSHLPSKAGAIGISIPGGKLQLFDQEHEIRESNREGELIYSGANVMLGYADNPEDLNLGDMMHGKLRTGDLGYRDQDGVYYLTGRLKRISKIYGQRINLDDIEKCASAFGEVVMTSDDMKIRIYHELGKKIDQEQCIAHLSTTYHLAPSTFEWMPIGYLPLTASGKIDYTQLK